MLEAAVRSEVGDTAAWLPLALGLEFDRMASPPVIQQFALQATAARLVTRLVVRAVHVTEGVVVWSTAVPALPTA